MKTSTRNRVKLSLVLVLATTLTSTNCRNQHAETAAPAVAPATVPANPAVTFLELGSVGCAPCKAMVGVMKSVEKKYGSQIKVVFYNILKGDEDKGEKYEVRVLPTQVFLDSSGKEFSRHEGFYPEAELDQLLQARD
jgi:thiol-disulfide isomerase/thioredoxin